MKSTKSRNCAYESSLKLKQDRSTLSANKLMKRKCFLKYFLESDFQYCALPILFNYEVMLEHNSLYSFANSEYASDSEFDDIHYYLDALHEMEDQAQENKIRANHNFQRSLHPLIDFRVYYNCWCASTILEKVIFENAQRIYSLHLEVDLKSQEQNAIVQTEDKYQKLDFLKVLSKRLFQNLPWIETFSLTLPRDEVPSSFLQENPDGISGLLERLVKATRIKVISFGMQWRFFQRDSLDLLLTDLFKTLQRIYQAFKYRSSLETLNIRLVSRNSDSLNDLTAIEDIVVSSLSKTNSLGVDVKISVFLGQDCPNELSLRKLIDYFLKQTWTFTPSHKIETIKEKEGRKHYFRVIFIWQAVLKGKGQH